MEGREKKWEPIGQRQSEDADLKKMIAKLNRQRAHPISKHEEDQIRAAEMRKNAGMRMLGLAKKARAVKKSQPWLVANEQAGRQFADRIRENRMVAAYFAGRSEPQPEWKNIRTGKSAKIVENPATGEETIVRKPGSTPKERVKKVDEIVKKAEHQAQIYAPVELVERGEEYFADLQQRGMEGYPNYYDQDWEGEMNMVDQNFRATQQLSGQQLRVGKHTLQSFKEEREKEEAEEEQDAERERLQYQAQEEEEAWDDEWNAMTEEAREQHAADVEQLEEEVAAQEALQAANAWHANVDQQRADISHLRGQGYALMPNDPHSLDFDFPAFVRHQAHRRAEERARLEAERTLQTGEPDIHGKRRNE